MKSNLNKAGSGSSELAFSKQAQLGGVRSADRKEQDARFKRCFIVLWNKWLELKGFVKSCPADITFPMDMLYEMGAPLYCVSADMVDLAHIAGKKAHPETRYAFANVQLLSQMQHRGNEHGLGGEQQDCRPPEFIEWAEQFDFMGGDI